MASMVFGVSFFFLGRSKNETADPRSSECMDTSIDRNSVEAAVVAALSVIYPEPRGPSPKRLSWPTDAEALLLGSVVFLRN